MFTEGDDLYASMLSAIAGAKESIRLESYIFADDAVGNRFCQALIERAQAGIAVKVHIDAAGSLFWFSRKMQNHLRCNGVKLRWFHRWSWRRPWRYNRRNHRKMLIVDDRVAFLGGFNIHQENSREYYGDARWRDTHVSFGGSLVDVAVQLFDAFWQGRLRWQPMQKEAGSRLLHNHTLTCRHRLRCVYGAAFDKAKTFIYLTTPYFVPDSHTLSQLRQAAERGVDVRLLVPGESDVRIARWAARHIYASLLDSGVRIFEYLPRMLHAKTVVVDDNWSMVGTANLDYRSLFINYELNLATADRGLAAELKVQFLQDLSQSESIESQDWERRDGVSRWLERIAMMVKRWL
ncbi:phospholipase D/transphosphatidylase [Alcanivorax nanhaiticus]|uniref:Phospholipase D/transphosphatidylase n=1 Tax=Alcanivorax nanhaiticus TaxID=1177154 RepID=A0A095SP48_9GAMM|nr:phospholipase D/transphosphatidylase [Alcanivorax nanhaiticus]